MARVHSGQPSTSFFRSWDDAPALLLSCPGPLRQHIASVQPISQLALPQCLLGSEAQLLAFIAAHEALSSRMFFVPLPEMFSGPASMQALDRACGLDPAQRADGPRLVHLRFGGTRSARVLKDARNALVLAENHRAPPITASRHPFATGLTVPASIRRVLALDPHLAVPAAIGGATLPVTLLDGDYVAADLRRPAGRRGAAQDGGLDIVSLAEFRSNVWAAGPVRAGSDDLAAAMQDAARDGAPFVLVPWNLDHPGSAVPALVARTLRLQHRHRPAVRLVILPFNYPGQTGLIRRLIRQLRQNIEGAAAAMPHLFLGRLTDPAGLPALRRIARVAWVDGNDPEQDWTMRRLAASGFAPILLAADAEARPGTVMIAADDALTIEAETRFGLLHFHAKLPSLRGLRALLPLTHGMSGAGQPRAAPGRRRKA